jgi:hypothetical protein
MQRNENDTTGGETRRRKLLAELQDRVKTIQYDIARLESQIITATEEKYIHEEDLQFHLQLIDELGGFEEESDTAESVEIIPSQQQTTTAVGEPKGTEQARKPTKAEIQEQKDKARAWHLNRVRRK